MKRLLLLFCFIAGLSDTAWSEKVTLSNDTMEITLDNFKICSLKISGVERLIQGNYKEFSPGIVIKDAGKLYSPEEIKLTDIKKNGNVTDINGEIAGISVKLSLCSLPKTIRFDLNIESKSASDFSGYIVLPTSYEGIEYFRYDDFVKDKETVKEDNNLRLFDPDAGFYQEKRKNGFKRFPFRQIPVAVMNYSDKYYLSVERVAEKNLKNYTPVFVEGKGNETPVLSLLVEVSSGYSPVKNMPKKVVLDLRGNSYNYNFFDQAMMDAYETPANSPLTADSTFDISHNALPKGVNPSKRMMVFSWGERDMCFDGSPTKNGYKSIRDSIIEAKKVFPNAKMLLYWSPTLHINADLPGYNYSDKKKTEYTDCAISGEDGKKTGILYHGKVTNYYQNMDPALPYGSEVLKNVENLFKEVPEADGMFWDNFYYGTPSYAIDWDFSHKSSSLMSMVKFITALKQLPSMQKRLICANGAIEPYTASLMDCFLSESFPRGVAALYPMRFGKPIYFLRKLGTLSLSEARYWNIYPNGSFIFTGGSFPFDCNPETWPKPVIGNGKIVNPFEIYYPDSHRYVAFARKYNLWDTTPKEELISEDRNYTLKELGFKIVGNEKPPFYVEYFQSKTMTINAFQKYDVVKTFINNYDDLKLQPHISATLEPMAIKLKVEFAQKGNKRILLIKPMHGENVLNKLTLSAKGMKETKISYTADGKYAKDGNNEGFLIEIPSANDASQLVVTLKNEQNETLEANIPVKEFTENRAILTITPKVDGDKKSEKDNEISVLLKKENQKNDLGKYSADWQSLDKWRPSSHRVSMFEFDKILKVSYTPGPLYRWDSIVQYFKRHPGTDWSQYSGLGMWIYADDEGFNKMILWILHSYGHVKDRDAVKTPINLIPNKWNYVFIDFSKFKFDFKDVWVLQFNLDANCFKEKNKTYNFFIGAFFLIPKDTDNKQKESK